LELTEEPIKQKWNGLAQHVAQYVLKHADTVVLTLFSTLENVSIYYVYHLVTNGLQQMMEILTTGMSALLGNMYAKREEEKLMQTYSTFEWLLHTAVTLVYTIAGVLILPFVSVYTRGITDANYIVPLFAVLIVGANGAYCIRLPYNIMVNAAGHFKETQASAIIEAAMNVVISIALVYNYGLIGVAIGTLVSMLYRTTYLAFYLSKHILNRSFKHYLLHWAVDLIVILSGYFSTRWITLGEETYGSWIVMAIKVGTIILIESTIINLVFYRQTCIQGIRLLGRRRNKN
jgi:O-antigen/teichoic acid export membrane protein